MLHFSGISIAGTHPSIWGTSVTTTNKPNPINYIYQEAALHPPPMVGQPLAGIGFYRMTTGQPMVKTFGGSFSLGAFAVSYEFIQGQYSFGLQTFMTVAEVLSVQDVGVFNGVFGIDIVDAFNSVDTSALNLLANITVADQFSLVDTYDLGAVYGVILPENLFVKDITDSNAPLIAYVMNTQTGAMTTYENFNFNSFGEFDGKFYGTDDTGICELTGTTDHGTPIAASIRFPLETFGVDSKKQVPSVYLGLATTGNLYLKTTVAGVVYTYLFTPGVTGAQHTGRVIIGKGLESRFWDFELSNVNGEDFTLDWVEFNAVVLSRRT